MATKEKTSWADETDEFEEQQAVPSTWNRNNNQVQEKSDTQENVDNKGSDNEEQPEESNDDKGRKPRKVVPFPDEPPYTAFVGNLAYDIYREEISGFFDRRNCKVESVRLLMNKETNKAKGFGYVVFQDLDSLKRAVELNGENLLDRPLRIDVAESRNEREDPYKRRDRETRGNNRNTRYQNNRNYDRKPQYDKEQNGDKEQQEELKERPKIDIKPRTVTPTTSEESSETYQSAKVNPFGQAKPRDESLVMKKKEQEKQQRTEDEDQETAVVTEKSPEVKDNKGNKFNGRRDDNKPRREGEKSSNKPKYDRSKTNKRDNKNKDKKDDKPRQIRTKEPEKQEQKSVHVSSKNIFDALEQEDD